jgi:hypothetical protein
MHVYNIFSGGGGGGHPMRQFKEERLLLHGLPCVCTRTAADTRDGYHLVITCYHTQANMARHKTAYVLTQI